MTIIYYQKIKQCVLDFIKSEPGKTLFILFLLIASFTYQHYGMSWDERQQRKTGMISFNYVFKGDDALLRWGDKDYGVGFELPLIIAEKTLKLKDWRHIYLMRHFLTHLFFLIAAYYLYKLVYLLYKNKKLASIAFLLLVMHPRIYSHSFFNTKDIPFLSMTIICFYLTVLAFKNKSYKNFIYLGIAIGFLVNIRLMGILLPAIIVFYLIIDALLEKQVLKHFYFLILFIFVSALTLYISWPYLWEAPFDNFHQSFANMSKFRWESATLFNGEMIPATETPSNYFTYWFFITTPLIFLATFILGFIKMCQSSISKPLEFFKNSIERTNLLFLGYILASIGAVIYLESILYDSWRQLFYLYPCFVLVGIYGLSEIKSTITRKVSYGFIGIGFALVLFHSIKQYPLQYVYFNNYVDQRTENQLRRTWEMDYWGVSYYWALKYILEHDNTHNIKVAFDHGGPGNQNVFFLPHDQRERFILSDRENCDYYIVNYRWQPNDYKELHSTIWYNFKLGRNSFCTIFRFKCTNPQLASEN